MWFANPGWRTQSRAALDAAAAAPWTPASLGAALIAWYKADAGVYNDAGTTLATNGQPVQQWNDQSGHGYHLVQTGVSGVRPTFLTATLNGLPVLNFDSTSGTQDLETVGQPVILGGTTLSAFMLRKVITVSGLASTRVWGIDAGSGDINPDVAILEYCPGTSIITPTTYNAGNKGANSVVSGTWNQTGTIFDGVNNTFYVANSAGTPVAATPTFASPVKIVLFGTAGNTTNSTGQCAEIILTNTAMNSTDRSNLATYLTGRWGI